MKSTKQIREQFDLITEKEEKEDRKLSALVRAGLYDAKKLPALKKALEKSADKITSQEKRMLVNLLDSLISQVVSDDQVYRKVRQNVHSMNEAKMDTYSKFDPRYKAGWPTDKEMPSVLILKRKAIRVYPDNQKVALYYSQSLDKYVTIPYNDIQMGLNEAKKKDDDDKDNRRIDKALRRNPKYKKVSTILKTGKVPRETDTTASNKRFDDVSKRLGGGIEGAMGAYGVKINTSIKDRFRAKAVEKAVAARKDPNSSRNIKINAMKAARAAQTSTLEENAFLRAAQGIGTALKFAGNAGTWVAKKAGQAFSKGNKVAKPTGKGLGKGGKGKGRGRLGLAAGAGIGAAAAGGGSGSGSNASDSSSAVNHKFSLKPNLSIPTRVASDEALKKRDARLNRLAMAQQSVANESNILDTIKSIVENDISEQTVQFNENKITINNTVAKKLLNVYESVNKTNKKKMEQMLNESATSFNKVLTFAVRQ
jgi:hypothetical protein